MDKAERGRGWMCVLVMLAMLGMVGFSTAIGTPEAKAWHSHWLHGGDPATQSEGGGESPNTGPRGMVRGASGVLTPTWYKGDWWTYSRVWSISLGALGYVNLADNCTYKVEQHEDYSGYGGTNDVYNVSVNSINVDGDGSVYVSDINSWINFYINEDGSFINGYMLMRRSDLAMVKMFVYVHLFAGLTEGGGIANLDLNITLEPEPGEEDYDFPVETGDEWHQNWTIHVYGDYQAEVPDLPPEDSVGNISEVIQMDSDYWCNETQDVSDPHGGTMNAYFIDSTGTDLSDAPGGKQMWWYSPDVKWFQRWYITDVSLGDMGGSEGKINMIDMVLKDYGEGSAPTNYQAYIEDGSVVNTVKGGKVLVQASADSVVMVPEMGLSEETSYNSESGYYECLFTLPDSDDTTPSVRDEGSFGVIIQDKTTPPDGVNYVVRTVSFTSCDLQITGVEYDTSNVLTAGQDVDFTLTLFNNGDAFVGTPIDMELNVDNVTAVSDQVRALYGMGEKSYVMTWTPSSGHHTLSFVIDAANAVYEASEDNNIYNITVDVDIPPTPHLSVNRTECYTFETIEFNATLSTDEDGTIAKYEWDFDGDGKSDDTGAVVEHFFSDGGPVSSGGKIYNVTLIVTDDLGGKASESVAIKVYNRLPHTAMEIRFSVGGRDFTYNHFKDTIVVPPETEVTFDASESSDLDGDVVGYEWSFGGDTFTTTNAVYTNTWYDTMGETDCRLRAVDDDGEYGNSIDFVIKVANMPPNITVNIDNDHVKTFETVSVSASIFDPDGEIRQIWWDYDCDFDSDNDGIPDNDWDSTEEYISVSYEDGSNDGKEYHIKVSAKDDDNEVTEVLIPVYVYNRPPTPALPAPENVNIVMGKEFTFDLSGCSDEDGKIVEYYLDFGDGSNTGWESWPAETASAEVTHTYDTNGTYMLTLTIKDDDGAEATVYENYTVKFKNEKPVITAVSGIPEELKVGENFTLSVVAQDADGRVVRMEIDFGDGTKVSDEHNTSFTHAYQNEGTYTITIRVYDDVGDYAIKESSVKVLPKGGGGGEESRGSASEADYTFPVLILVVVIVLVALATFMSMRKRGNKGGGGSAGGGMGGADGGGGGGGASGFSGGEYSTGGGVRGLS